MRLKTYCKQVGEIRYGPYFIRYDGKASHHISADEHSMLKSKLDSIREQKRANKLITASISSSCYADIKEFLQAAGYRVKGENLHIIPGIFFTIDAARVRFGLLSEDHRKSIGSAMRLLELSSQAWKRHKRLNARRIKNSFLGCLNELCDSL